ncbi:hypothetical protein ACIQGZ_16625 [Streptomyces sp. NPDC092296]|uniref:hypothetical protein n=1 Tax=Streptomyces sp. NPDC092296 TaxID=3366012 RepID=UPI0038007A08
MTLVTSVVGYLAAALCYARYLYMRERARIIAQENRHFPGEDPAERFRAVSQESTAVTAFVAGLVWPLLLPVHLVYRCAILVIMGRPDSTEAERSFREAQRRRRIAVLERELGLEKELGLREAPGAPETPAQRPRERVGRRADGARDTAARIAPAGPPRG